MEIDVVPPDVNRSGVKFLVADSKIHFALSAIKGCGGSAAESIVKEREENGPFKDIFDFCERVEASQCNRSSIETLIKAGAMDSFGAHRSQLMAVLDRAMQSGAVALADKKSGQGNLFGDDFSDDEEDNKVDLPVMDELDERQKLVFEKEVLGYYLTSHPLAQYVDQLRQYCSHTTSTIGGLKDRDRVSLGGMISSLKHSNVKRVRDPSQPTKYVMFDLEDVDGAIRCIVWPTEFAEMGKLVQADAIVVLQGSLDRRGGDEANLIVDRVIPIEQLDSSHLTTGICVRIDEQTHGQEAVKKVYEIVRGYPGSRKLQLEIRLDDGVQVKLDTHKLRVDINEQLCKRLKDCLGPNAFEMMVG